MLDTMSASLMVALTYQEKSSLPHLYFITFFYGLNKEQVFCPGEIFNVYLTSRNVSHTSLG